MDWTREMDKMLSVFESQAMQSLGIIKSAFRGNGLSFESTFKGYFLRASTNRLSETFDRFEIKSKLDDKMMGESSDEVDEMKSAHSFNQSLCKATERREQNKPESVEVDNWSHLFVSDVRFDSINRNVSSKQGSMETVRALGPAIQIDDSDDEDFVTQTLGTGPTDDPNGTNESIVHQSNTYEGNTLAPAVGSDFNFAVEMDESNDSIKMIENQNCSTDADDDMIIPVNNVLNPLDETTNAELANAKIKATRLTRKNSDKKRITTSIAKIQNRSGPYGCDRCGKRFSSGQLLMKHAATHIEEFPFHCRACFQGFSLKTEAAAHEKRCKKRHYECHLCKKFVTFIKPQITAHMRIHTGDKPLRCQICMKTFGWKYVLKRHLNTVHTKMPA